MGWTNLFVHKGAAFEKVDLPEMPPLKVVGHRQMYGLVQKFDRFDENGDGYLTRKELAQGAAQSGLHLTPAKLNKAMKGYDKNGDKRISQHEAQLGADQGPDIFGPE